MAVYYGASPGLFGVSKSQLASDLACRGGAPDGADTTKDCETYMSIERGIRVLPAFIRSMLAWAAEHTLSLQK